MGLYSDWIFPHLLEWTLGRKVPMEYRHRALADARGDVLEIGFGTGLNLTCFPAAVERLTLIDPAKLLSHRVARRIAAAPMPIEQAYLNAERLPFEAGRFDTVVSTWTLCTIPDAAAALSEVLRVLKPSGKLLFLEHGRMQIPKSPSGRIVGTACSASSAAAAISIARSTSWWLPPG